METKIRCTHEDLNHVIELFRTSVEQELENVPTANIDVSKVVTEFRNFLLQSIEPVASFEEDQQAQQLKVEIENLQRKAVRVKSSLQSKRTMFIEEVQTQTGEMLKRRRPRVKDLDEKSIDIDFEVPSELDERLNLPDNEIAKLQSRIPDAQRSASHTMSKYE